MSRRVAVVNTEDTAARVRETFHDSKAKKRVAFPFGWPTKLTYVGDGWGIIYWSDKWKTEDTYKHKREGDWDVYLAPSLLDLDGLVKGSSYQIKGTMPKHVAYIGKFVGIQFKDLKGKSRHLELEKAHWAAAKIPSTGETVLLAYDKQGVQILVIGDTLDIEKDGIVG